MKLYQSAQLEEQYNNDLLRKNYGMQSSGMQSSATQSSGIQLAIDRKNKKHNTLYSFLSESYSRIILALIIRS